MLSKKKKGVEGAALLGCCHSYSLSGKKRKGGGCHCCCSCCLHSCSCFSCCCYCWWCQCWCCHHHHCCCSHWGCMYTCPPLSLLPSLCPCGSPTAAGAAVCCCYCCSHCHCVYTRLPHMCTPTFVLTALTVTPSWAIPLLLWPLLLVLVLQLLLRLLLLPLGLCVHTPSMYVHAHLGPLSLSAPLLPLLSCPHLVCVCIKYMLVNVLW
jgi:hypothetical protein